MYWNHRLLRKIEDEGKSYEEEVLYMVEVYYDNDDHKIIGWTEKEVVWGEDVDEIRQTLHWMLDATEKPILDEKELLAQAAIIRESGEDSLFSQNHETLTLDEVLESLGLEREDIGDWDPPEITGM